MLSRPVEDTTRLDDDKNGRSADGKKMCGAVEQKDKSTDKIYNEGLDVNNREKDSTHYKDHDNGSLTTNGSSYLSSVPSLISRGAASYSSSEGSNTNHSTDNITTPLCTKQPNSMPLVNRFPARLTKSYKKQASIILSHTKGKHKSVNQPMQRTIHQHTQPQC